MDSITEKRYAAADKKTAQLRRARQVLLRALAEDVATQAAGLRGGGASLRRAKLGICRARVRLTVLAEHFTEGGEAMEEKKTLFIPRGGAGEDPNLYVGFNGKNYVLPRGKQSTVPAPVAAEIQRAWKAQEALDATVERLSN